MTTRGAVAWPGSGEPQHGSESPSNRRRSSRHGSDDLDWPSLWRTLWRRKVIPLSCLVIALTVTDALISRMPETFEAEALVMLNTPPPQPALNNPVESAAPPYGGYVNNQMLLITSSSLVGEFVDRLQLNLLPEFNPTLREGGSWAQALLIDLLPERWADRIIGATSGVEMTDLRQSSFLRDEIVAAVTASISVSQVPDSTTLSIKFLCTDPTLAAIGANTLADLYLSYQLATKLGASNKAIAFFEPEIERLRASLAADEQAVQTYRSENGLEGARPSDQQVSELTTQLVLSRSETAEKEARLRQVESALASDVGLPQAAQMLNSEVLTALNLRAIELDKERAELSGELGPKHPRMHILQAELKALNDSKRHEIRQIAQNLKDEVQVSRSRERALATSIEAIRRSLANYQAAEVGLAALQRPASADQALLETYINRSKEFGSLLKAQTPDAQIISTAQPPNEAAYPRRHLIFGIVAFSSLLLGALAAFGLERLDRSFRSFEQIEDLIGLPGLGLLPTITDRSPADYILGNPNSAFGTAVRRLRTSVLLTSTAMPPKTVLVTSSVPGEGKTSLAASLARINARSGKSTLLIDCDLRLPRVHRVFGITNKHGLSDVLQMRRDPNGSSSWTSSPARTSCRLAVGPSIRKLCWLLARWLNCSCKHQLPTTW